MHYLLLITSLLVIGFTSLVSIPGSPYLIGGMTQADISAMFPTAITPAGITFSIWSAIYLSWLAAGVSLSGLPLTHLTKKYFPRFARSLEKQKVSSRAILSFSAAIALTAFWLIPWGYIWIGSALIVMIAILALLKYAFHYTRESHPIVRYSVELTLGWINIATVANVTIWLVSLGFTGGSIPELYWAIGVLGLALLLTAYYQCRYRSYIVSIVFLWTMLGVWIAHPLFEQRVAVVIYAAVTLVNMVYSYYKKR